MSRKKIRIMPEQESEEKILDPEAEDAEKEAFSEPDTEEPEAADGQAEENVPVIETDKAFLEKIDQIIEKNNVAKWNGYHMSARDVLDGDGFSLSIKMDNGQKISAGSYMAWPDGYGAFKGGRLAAWRLLRCNPFSKGGYDPVPEDPTTTLRRE